MPAIKRKPAPEPEKTAAKKTRLSQDAEPQKSEKRSTRQSAVSADGKQKTKSTTPSVKPSTKTAVSANKSHKAGIKADDMSGFSSDDEAEPDSRQAAAAAVESALLAGFSSSDSESDNDADKDEQARAIKKVPSVPKAALLDAQLAAAATKPTADPERTPGVVYISRIPHGFYEPQMREYFGQFGSISRLRLSRNKATGKSKHYAWIEFESAAVADIVARTMDKYLLFNHILQVRLLRDEEVHPELWKGAGRRFKAMPRAKIEAGGLNKGKGRDRWAKAVDQEQRTRRAKAKRLREDMGYEYAAPALKTVDSVPRRIEALVDAIADEVVVGEIEGPAEAEDKVGIDEALSEAVQADIAASVAAETAAAKRKKGRKEKTGTKKARLSE